MTKRIVYGSRRSHGQRIAFAKIQVLIMDAVWFNVKVVEDPDKEYVQHRAEECLQYMQDEKYED